MKASLFLLILFLVLTPVGYCENWTLYYGNSEYYDRDSVAPSASVKSVWLKSTAPERRDLEVAGDREYYGKFAENAANYAKFAVEVDCTERTVRTMASYFYDSSDRLLKRSIPPEAATKRIPIMAETPFGYKTKEEYLFEAVCRETPE